MKQNISKALIGAFFATSMMLQSGPVLAAEKPAAGVNLADFILEPMPDWYNERYTRGHLNIAKMIKSGYSRFEAIEIQNQMKDILDRNPVILGLEKAGKTTAMVENKDPYFVAALEMAIERVKKDKVFESGFKPEKLGENEFYVVFDLDETLLVQWYEAGLKGNNYYDIKVPAVYIDNILKPVLTSPDYVSLTPGFEKTLKDISAIPGCKGIIFFSAKLDTATNAIADQMRIDGKPIRTFIKGLFTRNHLIREEEPAKLAKDLRIFDESLKRVIMIDDNPTRIFEKQKKNLREFPKYNPDEYLKAKHTTKDQKVINYFEKLLPTVVEEIKESAAYARANKMPFAEAYYPYSMDGQAELISLQRQGYNMKDAIDFIRKNKALFEPKFFFYEEKTGK